LGLAIDEVIHHYEVSVIVQLITELHIAARDPNQEHFLARVERDPDE
jgi:hypothetical protein